MIGPKSKHHSIMSSIPWIRDALPCKAKMSIPGSIRQAKALFPCLSSWCLSPMHVFHLLYPGRHSWVHIRHWQAIPLYRFLCRMLAGTSPTSMPHEMATSKRLDCTLHKSLVLCSICRQTLWGCYHIFPHLWKWIFCGHFVLKLVYSLNRERLRQVLGVEVVLGGKKWNGSRLIRLTRPLLGIKGDGIPLGI